MRRRQTVNHLLRVGRVAGFPLLLVLVACSGDAERAMSQGAVAETQFASGDLAAARKSIAAAIDERDDLAALQLLRGRIEIAGQRFAPAFDAYSAALALEATNMEALQGVAQLGLRTGHLDASEEATGRILALSPDQPDALLIKGLLALVRNRPVEAIENADRILASAPGNEGGVILKARALYLRGEPAQALAMIEKAVPLAGNSAGLVLTRLELMREVGNAAGMLAQFAALHKLRPDDFDLTIDEANLRYKTGDKQAARTLLSEAVLARPRTAAQVAGITALWRDYDPEPLDASGRARLRQASGAARAEVARFYLDSGRAKEALELLAGDASLAARALAARATIAAGDRAGGAAAAETILETDQTQCDALIARSAKLLDERRGSPAIVAAQTAAAECPQNAAAWLQLAKANEARGKAAEVSRAFADAVLRNPQDANLSVGYVAWLERQGVARQAVAEARRLTRKAPALMGAWTAYLAVCEHHAEAGCATDARNGRSKALGTLGIDRPIGQRAPNGLFGRLPQR